MYTEILEMIKEAKTREDIDKIVEKIEEIRKNLLKKVDEIEDPAERIKFRKLLIDLNEMLAAVIRL